ncbi:MAG: hypothetical protein JW712_02995 [Dehalococcoidales bacterium]|nr:hypothetical protein [Dehalococcoidales bacterium]
MKILLFLMNALEMSDGIFTEYAVGNNLVKEGNDLMKSVVLNGDFIVFKILGVLACSACLWLLYKKFPRIAMATTSGIVLFYSIVIVWNIGCITTL